MTCAGHGQKAGQLRPDGGLVDGLVQFWVDWALKLDSSFVDMAENHRGLEFDIERRVVWKDYMIQWTGMKCKDRKSSAFSQGILYYFHKTLFPQTLWWTLRYLSPKMQVSVLFQDKGAQKTGVACTHVTNSTGLYPDLIIRHR